MPSLVYCLLVGRNSSLKVANAFPVQLRRIERGLHSKILLFEQGPVIDMKLGIYK